MSVVRAAEVKAFIASHLAEPLAENGVSPSELTDDFDLMKKGIIDSIDLINLVSAIEEHFRIEVDFEDMDTEELTVIGPLGSYIEKRAKSKDA
jgi:acyl carrier protein